MDDFLHNLRSGKLKQQDRSNRPYNDPQYKGGQRRPMMDRRKKEFEAKESLERLTVLKEVLENLAESQKRIAEAHEARNLVEERKANAMEILAKNLYQMLNPNAENIEALFPPHSSSDKPKKSSTAKKSVPAREVETDTTWEETDIASKENDVDEGAVEEAYPEAEKLSGKLTSADQQTLYPVISRMREKGNSWERIARYIADQGYPTLSGKGQWRGVMVKNLFEKVSA